MGRLRERLYDASVAGALWFYERWVLPQGWWAVQRVGIRELKLREFRERRALLNPYKREQLIA